MTTSFSEIDSDGNIVRSTSSKVSIHMTRDSKKKTCLTNAILFLDFKFDN